MRGKQYIGLEAKILEKGDTGRTIAKCLGINEGSVYNKRTGKTDFTAREIRLLKERFDLTPEEVDSIFFS